MKKLAVAQVLFVIFEYWSMMFVTFYIYN